MTNTPKLSQYFAKEKPLTFWIIVTGLFTSTLIIWIPALQGNLIDSVFEGGQSLETRIFIFLSFVILVQFLRFWKRYLVRKFENRTVREIRKTIYNNILENTIESMDENTAGSLMNKIIGDVNIVSEGLRKIITEIFDTVIMLSGYIVLMSIADFRITILVALLIPVGVFISTYLKKVVARYNSVFRAAKGDINDLIYQNVTHAVLFRLMGLSEQFGDAFKAALPGLRKKAVRASFFDTSLTPLYNAISLGGVVFVIVIGSSNIESGYWTIGQFSAYLVMFALVARKSGMISTYITLWQKTVVSWDRLKGHLEPVYAEKGAPVSLLQPVKLKFENVRFKYDDSEETLIHNLSFEGGSGQIIGIAGPIASGKSTILRLLTTLMPTSGKIEVNGLDFSELNTFQRSGIVAYKPHGSELFSGSIKENIAFDETNEENLNNVLSGVALERDIDTISGGIEARIGGNVSVLSGGQQDRVSLARTLFADKSIILLDDPFSALDMKTEIQIIKYLRENFKDHLILINSHRFAIFPYTDSIIFLDGAGSYMLGSHDELLASNPLYLEIYNMQKGAIE
ncbi:MAG: ABC transporter ATP-binding protein/permease [Defluviitaleaceae bacterium]|nr:ABC transporter ATP-binding protein/permease [Defluviitaleaceae bacterium]